MTNTTGKEICIDSQTSIVVESDNLEGVNILIVRPDRTTLLHLTVEQVGEIGSALYAVVAKIRYEEKQ